jgi:hypothetical protein
MRSSVLMEHSNCDEGGAMKRGLIGRRVLAFFATALVLPVVAQATSPYAGQERNDISSLAPQEVNALLAGHGMAFAKTAELNGYPGPLHVIELADPLALTPDQLDGTRKLMEAHRSRARTLGAELVAAERTLDRLFKQRNASAASVSAAAERIGVLQARLRAEHLNTHLAQTRLLNAEQIRRYAELRGYSPGSAQSGSTPRDHPKSTHSPTH